MLNACKITITITKAKVETCVPIINYYDNGTKRSKLYMIDGDILHSTEYPAEVRWDEDGKICYAAWFSNGHLHRTNGPAVSEYAKSQVKKMWFLNGNLHRTDGPAIIIYSNNSNEFSEYGKKQCEMWYLENKLRLTVKYDLFGKKIIVRNNK